MEKNIQQLFAYPFRIFFLSAALWAIMVIPFWVGWISGGIHFDGALNLMTWHQHEMLFGLVNPAIAGFLLTAVCVWTQTDRVHGLPLLVLWLLWCVGRLVSLVDMDLPFSVIVSINLAFIPVLLFDAGLRVWKTRQQRQYVLLVLLVLLWIAEAGVLIDPNHNWAAIAMVVVFALMSVIGGRITPGFSSGWLRQHGKDAEAVCTSTRLDWVALLLTVAVAVGIFTKMSLVVSILALAAGIAQLIRIARWRGWLVAEEPLLWILHVSILWIPIALLLLFAGGMGWINQSLWLHAGGIGAISSLILGVMARVALGHTGRPLLLPRFMVTAFLLIQASALVRIATAGQVFDWRFGVMVSAGLWVVAFALYLWRYTGILMSPRVDGRPG